MGFQPILSAVPCLAAVLGRSTAFCARSSSGARDQYEGWNSGSQGAVLALIVFPVKILVSREAID